MTTHHDRDGRRRWTQERAQHSVEIGLLRGSAGRSPLECLLRIVDGLSIMAVFVLALFLSDPAIAQSEVPTPLALGPSTLVAIYEQGWHETVAQPDQWKTWARDDDRLIWSAWEPSMRGQTGRLGMGNEAVRFFSEGDQCVLGLARGEGAALSLVAKERAMEDLMSLATTFSDDGTVWTTVGQSVEGRPIENIRLGRGLNTTLFFGVFHGDEPAGDLVLRRLVQYLVKTPEVLEGRSVLICPVLNPDGLAKQTRVNARQVDLNRNYPVSNWTDEGKGTRYWGGPMPASEPETGVVIDLLESFRPKKIVTLHATLHNLNFDGPALSLAQRMSAMNGYVVEPDIGYPTPGSFGTYAGRERQIPVITLEFPEGEGAAMWLENREALLEAIRYDVEEDE